MINDSPDGAELIQRNAELNEKEYRQQKVELGSYPKAVFIQMDAPCNHDCLFCSRPEVYKHFDLTEFTEKYAGILQPVFERVEQINLTGSGELLFHPEAKRNLEYFNGFRHARKMFATNGSSLTPKMTDLIRESGSEYLIHVSLHSSDGQLHRRMTGANTYQMVMDNLEYISSVKSASGGLRLNLIFVATTENIHNLPEFIEFAHRMKADGVVVYYHYIYRMDQKEISCYFKQEFTNRMLDEARAAAEKLNEGSGWRMDLSLPPAFNRPAEPDNSLCSEAWNQVMINSSGDVISCDVGGDSYENLSGKKDFFEVWNGDYYTKLRKDLKESRFDCAQFCFRANANTVNKLKSHVITRGRSEEELEKFLSE